MNKLKIQILRRTKETGVVKQQRTTYLHIYGRQQKRMKTTTLEIVEFTRMNLKVITKKDEYKRTYFQQ